MTWSDMLWHLIWSNMIEVTKIGSSCIQHRVWLNTGGPAMIQAAEHGHHPTLGVDAHRIRCIVSYPGGTKQKNLPAPRLSSLHMFAIEMAPQTRETFRKCGAASGYENHSCQSRNQNGTPRGGTKKKCYLRLHKNVPFPLGVWIILHDLLLLLGHLIPGATIQQLRQATLG